MMQRLLSLQQLLISSESITHAGKQVSEATLETI